MSTKDEMEPVDGSNDINEEDDLFNNENPADIIREFGTNARMQSVHRVIQQQLKDSKNKLQLQLVEKKELVSRLTQDRENQGVQLYSLQQQLAQLQLSLEASNADYNNAMDGRLKNEELMKEFATANLEKRTLFNEYQKQQMKYSSELASLHETLNQIEKYNIEVKSEIALNKRAAYKTEQSIQELEKNKQYQDILADNLSKQIQTLQQQIATFSNQLVTQQKETNDANSVLLETSKELELIANEKKQLILQWKASLSGLSRRDEALSQARTALQAAENAVYDYDVEIDGVKRRIQKEQEKHESLISMRDRLDHDLRWVEENLNNIRVEREQLQDRYALLTKSLSQTDVDNKKLDTITKSLDNEAESILQSIQVVTKERQQLEEELQLVVSTKTNINKAVENLLKEQSKVLKKIHKLENECNSIDNEIARTKVDILNGQSINERIKEEHAAVSKVLQEKESLINRCQVEIRQRNDEIEKKMYRVDRLNKKYEKMIENAGGEENLGPLENTIRNLRKEIESVSEECKELERDWLKRQTDLVNVVTESNKISDVNNELQARITLMTQQQLRINSDLRTLKSDVKLANQTYAELQKDILKLNVLINENNQLEEKLQQSNVTLEKDIVDELRDLEKETVQLESTIAEAKSSKAQLLDEIMDVERQASLWEKKIQLEKQTKDTLDPTVGQQETQSMEREIRRMTLRLDALKREQDRLTKEMENAIIKRSTIESRYTNTKSSLEVNKKKSSEFTQASVKKRIGLIKKEIKAMNDEIKEKNGLIDQKKSSLSEISSELEMITIQYNDAEETSQVLQSQINDLLYQKQLQQERIFYKQKYNKRLRELSQQGIDFAQTLPIERRLMASSQSLENVKEIIEDLTINFPHLRDVLVRVKNMTDIDISIASN